MVVRKSLAIEFGQSVRPECRAGVATVAATVRTEYRGVWWAASVAVCRSGADRKCLIK